MNLEVERRLRAIVATIASLVVGPASATDNAVVRFDATTGKLVQNSAFIVDDTGNVSSFGGQIKFPATQNPSADANTLDDYEEGTWTVSFDFATTGNLTLSAETKEAYYIKTGQQVFLYWSYDFTPTFTTSSGTARLTGAPFTHRNVTDANCIARGVVRHNGNITYNTSGTSLHMAINDNNTIMTFISSGSAVNNSALQENRFVSGVATEAHGSITYQASA